MISIVYKIIFICVFSAIVSIILKNSMPAFSPVIIMSSGIVCFYLTLPYLKRVFDVISNISKSVFGAENYVSITIKIVGISLLCEFAAQSCSDMGENTMAAKIGFAGKIVILCISAPEFLNLINKVINLVNLL